MRRLGVLVAVCLTAVGAAAASPAHRPTLRISTSPLVVRGVSFLAREHVRVTVSTAGTHVVRRTTTTSRGTFSVNAGALAFDPCLDGLVATAVGASGDRATAKLPQRECPAP